MSELMAAYSIVFRTVVLGFVLMAFPCLHEMSVVFAQGSADSVIEKAMRQAPVKVLEQVTEKTMDNVAEKAAQKAVEKAVQKAAVKAAQEETEQEELTAKRPDEVKGSTIVHFIVFILDIDDIDDAAQNFTANVYLRLRWKDARLANPKGAIRQIPMEEVWNPRVLLANQQGLVARALPEVVQVHPDGTVIYHQRYTGKLSQALKLADFPRDTHSFTVQFVATGYQTDELTFEPDLLSEPSVAVPWQTRCRWQTGKF